MSGPAIVVLTNERDFAADDVVRRLSERDVQVHRLNIETACTQGVEGWSPVPVEPSGVPPAVVWWRQFEFDVHPQSVDDVDDVLVERAQWRVWVATLSSPATTWINNLWAARRAENKVEQLRAAHQVGFTTPPTLVTNDPEQARSFREHVGPCVIKTLTSAHFSFSDQSFVFTEVLDDATLAADGWFRVPLIVQQLVRDGLDARVVSFGDRCFGARCRSREIDWRKAPFEPAMWQRWPVPTDIERACSAYRAHLGLEYAAFDFMITPGGIVVFLEANQAGEWGFLDRTLHLGITEALTDRLVLLAAGSKSRFGGHSAGGAGPLP